MKDDAPLFVRFAKSKSSVATAYEGAIVELVKAATTANITLSGTQTIDGIACLSGNLVLAKNQSATNTRGVYTVSTGTWTLKDIPDVVFVASGTTNGLMSFALTSTNTSTYTVMGAAYK